VVRVQGRIVRFPTARLLVYDRLLSGESCMEAIVNTAKDLGVISPNVLTNLVKPPGESCGSMFAAKCIIDECLCERMQSKLGYAISAENACAAEGVWAGIVQRLELYRDNAGQSRVCNGRALANPVDCGRSSPILMDILLQQLTPYID
jgi:hypothetical protein